MTTRKLIDVEKLKSAFWEEKNIKIIGGSTYTLLQLFELFDDQEIVEERRSGEWRVQDRYGISAKGYMACSECNVMLPDLSNNRWPLPQVAYCPWCGSKMSETPQIRGEAERICKEEKTTKRKRRLWPF